MHQKDILGFREGKNQANGKASRVFAEVQNFFMSNKAEIAQLV
jgi:hypothetical protein